MIGIVIVNYKTWEITRRCVDSIRECCTLPYRVYVIDNDSPNDSLLRLSEEYRNDEDVVVIGSGRNGGYGFALNCGFRQALADGCAAAVASNNDIVYLPGSLEKLYEILNRYPEVAVVGAQQIGVDGKEQRSASDKYYRTSELVLWYFPFSHRFFKGVPVSRTGKNYEPLDYVHQVAFTVGGCYMFNANVLGDGNFYDERVFMYAEEPIIGEKLKRAGRVALLRKDAQVIHKHHGTTGASLAFYHKTSAPSILLFCEEYAKLTRAQIRMHKFFFYILMGVKCLTVKDYRDDRAAVLSAIKKK